MKIDFFQIDAFASRAFEGNPAAVCPLDAWLPVDLMQSIAAENNLSETAFFVPEGDSYAIRWFTPTAEVDLCGHATLASAFVLFNCLGVDRERIEFSSHSGKLGVSRDDDLLILDFPAQAPVQCDPPPEIGDAFAVSPLSCWKSSDLLLVFDNEGQVRSARPDFSALEKVDSRGIIITAVGEGHDFVVRFFAPRLGIAEDPVTGSAYTQLVPYWSDATGKSSFRARQLSARGGEVFCKLVDDRVHIAGTAVKFLEGTIECADAS